MADVFISCSRKDKPFVDRFSEALSKASFLFIISPDSVASETCRIELDHAVELHKRLRSILRRPVEDDDVSEPRILST